jgi:UDP-N-acetylmuramate: L-alanyl-gamma-D-glutamyl-meso-diaminopimelate ligase
MRIHLIAIGGSVMHNLALALQKAGHQVTGSDDHIYDPARSRLYAAGLLPPEEGWNVERIHPQLDLIVLGMHARIDNPELIAAQQLDLSIVSFPEFIYRHAANKKRVVIAGSHGKTSTTSMLMHMLRTANWNFDYLVGAQLEGFDHMVGLSDAPLMILEGDEYLTSPLDRVPKIFHYQPHITAITGIAWDHMNVFPTEAIYQQQFQEYLQKLAPEATVYFYQNDPALASIVAEAPEDVTCIPYAGFSANRQENGLFTVDSPLGKIHPQVFGDHNFQNLEVATRIALQLGVPHSAIREAIETFSGAGKRLQELFPEAAAKAYLDFAHAPSKVKATTQAIADRYHQRRVTACLELHTFSSLNQDFLPQYQGTLDAADRAFVLFDPATLARKKMPPLSKELVARAFQHPNLEVFDAPEQLAKALAGLPWDAQEDVLLWMSSGPWGGLDVKALSASWLLP